MNPAPFDKRCFKCGAFKSMEDFYNHPRMLDGKLGKCKSCTKADVRKNYRKRLKQYRDYDKRRNRERRGYRQATNAMLAKKYQIKLELGAC